MSELIHHTMEQRTPDWFKVRAGKVTASGMPKLVTPGMKRSTQIKKYAQALAAEIYTKGPVDAWDGNHWTNRGNIMEEQARAWWDLKHDQDVKQCGFVENPSLCAGFSPDGLIGDSGILEIKCLSETEHVDALASKSPPIKYLPQVHAALAFGEGRYDHVTLLYFHPDMPKLAMVIEPSPLWNEIILETTADCIAQRDQLIETLTNLDE